MKTENQLEVIDLRIHCGKKTIVAGVSFACSTGCTAILGDIASGKSTLTRGLTRTLPEDQGWQVEGDVRLNRKSMWDFAPEAWRRHCTMIMQRPTAFPGTTEWNVAFAPRQLKVASESEIEQRVTGALELVELSHMAKQPADQLSGGQMQRMCIARAIPLLPATLILDEPSASQSPPAARSLAALVRQIANERIILVVSHDISFLERVASRFVFLHNDGTGATVRAQGPISMLRHPEDPVLAEFVGVSETEGAATR